MRPLLVAAALALAAASPGIAGAQEPPPEPRYEVFLLTMAQGAEVWELFGHNALLIRDRATGEDLAWNWGLFDFEQEAFIPRFLRGTMEYSMGPARLEPFLAGYAAANRTVFANEVLLTQEDAAALDAFVRWNFQPENRNYRYDYFRDNCSTRLRDALDGVLGGAIFAALGDRRTPHSYRWHVRRLVQDDVWLDQGISFMFGTGVDRPLTAWETAFLPVELLKHLEEVQRPDGQGGMRPLLGPRQVLFEATRPAEPEAPPAFSFLWVAAGLAAAGGIGWVGRQAWRRKRWAKAGLFAVVTVWGLFSGILGLLLVLFWFSHHVSVHWNGNLFHLSPLALALPVLVLRDLRGKACASAGAGARLALLIALLSVGAAVIQLTPLFAQGNAEVIALGLPVNLALAWVLTRFPAE
ncbi:MAG: DUF4105 domain-containing protein [Gemmatimonadota bacterium]